KEVLPLRARLTGEREDQRQPITADRPLLGDALGPDRNLWHPWVLAHRHASPREVAPAKRRPARGSLVPLPRNPEQERALFQGFDVGRHRARPPDRRCARRRSWHSAFP